MKSIEKLQRAVNAMRDVNGEENQAIVKYAVNLINEFLIDNETTPNVKADLFAICKRTEKIRIPMTGVYHDAEHEMAVASDTHILVATKADYNPEYAGKIVDKYGNEIKASFPNWMRVIPDPRRDDTEISLDPEMYKRAIKAHKAWCKMRGKKGEAVVKIHDDYFFANVETMLLASAYTEKLMGIDNRHGMYYRDDEKIVYVMPVMPPDPAEYIDTHTAFSIIYGVWHPQF